MKTNVFILAMMSLSMLSYGQENGRSVIEEVQITPPEYRGTGPAMSGSERNPFETYLEAALQYPGKEPIIGTEVIRFNVGPAGELSNFRIVNSLSDEIDTEVLRALEGTSGFWEPGSINGKAVTLEREVSIVFKPWSGYSLTRTARTYLMKGNKWMYERGNPLRALRYYNLAVKLLPNEESILAARSYCHHKLGNKEGATRDHTRLMALTNGYEGHRTTFDYRITLASSK
jgi:hypothetical protein